MAKRKSRMITDQSIIDSLVNTSPEDITSTMVAELFGEFNGHNRCNPYDLMTVPKDGYGIASSKRGVNSKPFVTTVGRFLFNKLYIEQNPTIYEAIGWVNQNISKKSFGSLYKKIGYLYLEDKISTEDIKRFITTTQFTMPFIQFLSPSFTDEMLLSSKKIGEKKRALLKANKAAVDAGDIKVVDGIQKELVDYAKDLLKDDPSMDTFNSGGGGDFGNNFKNMFIMKGTVRDPDPNKGYSIITSNYIDGVSEDEYADLANSLAEGPYSRSKKTEVGGYWEKLLVYALQHLTLDEPGSDCGTKRYIEEVITEGNIDTFMYNYVIEGNKLIEITSENKDRFIGKRVKLRFSSMCESKTGFCNKCAGNLWYRLGIKNVGVITPQIASTLKNLMMKAFHNSQVELVDMNVMEAFFPDSVATNESANIHMDLPR